MTTDHHDDIVYEVIRETGGKEADLLNRYLQRVGGDQHEILYYTEAHPPHRVTIHRGDRSSPVIAEAVTHHETGDSEIKFVESDTTIKLHHIDSLLSGFHGKSSFEYQGKKYHWKGHTALVDDETGVLLAASKSKLLDFHWHKLGNLIVTKEGQKVLDLVIVTGLVEQERSDEHKQSLDLARKKAMEAGIHVP